MSVKSRGFTLIELLVVVAIIGILAALILVSLNTARAKARDAIRESNLKQMKTALTIYNDTNGSYPPGCWNYYEKDGANYIPGLSPNYYSAPLPLDALQGQHCPQGIGDNSNWRTYYYCSNGVSYKLNVCSETTVATTSPWYDPFRPGYGLMVCSGEPACSSF